MRWKSLFVSFWRRLPTSQSHVVSHQAVISSDVSYALLQWMFTDTVQRHLVSNLCQATGSSVDAMRASLAPSFADDMHWLLDKDARANEKQDRICRAIVSHRCSSAAGSPTGPATTRPSFIPKQAMLLAGSTLSESASYQLRSLLYFGRIEASKPVAPTDQLHLAEILASEYAWTDAAHLVLTHALLTHQASACDALLKHPLVYEDKACLHAMACYCGDDLATEQAAQAFWHEVLTSVLADKVDSTGKLDTSSATDASSSSTQTYSVETPGDAYLAYIDAVRTHSGHDEHAMALTTQVVLTKLPSLVHAKRWPHIIEQCDPLLSYILTQMLQQLSVHNAPHLYELIIDQIVLNECGPFPTGRASETVEQARRIILQYLRLHWMRVHAVHGFDALSRWCLKELSAELDVDVHALAHVVSPPDMSSSSSPSPTAAASASDTSSMVAVTSAGLDATRAPERRGPSSLYASVLNKSAAQAAHTPPAASAMCAAKSPASAAGLRA